MSIVHELKTWPEYFGFVESGEKTFEVRKNDRDFKIGDILHLREWSTLNGYSGREIKRLVTYVMTGGKWGLEEGNCILGIQPPQRPSMEWVKARREAITVLELLKGHTPEQRDKWDNATKTCEELANIILELTNETGESNESLREALENLLQLKDWKDKHGKDEHYEKHQPLAWEAARKALNEYLKHKTEVK